jgi:hypothetical protein
MNIKEILEKEKQEEEAKKILKKAQQANARQQKAIKYLNNNSKDIIENTIKILLKQDSDFDFKDELKEVKEKFKSNLIKGHFAWAIKSIDIPGNKSWDTYNEHTMFDIQHIYCPFYESAIIYVDSISDLSINVKKHIVNQLDALRKHYC